MPKKDSRIDRFRKLENLPRHIAIIMDGNGRWAKQRGLPRIAGHHEGIKSVRRTVEVCGEIGVNYLTLYTFSVQNWRRPIEEVSALMKLLVNTTKNEQNDLMKNNVRLRAIGNLDAMPKATQRALKAVIEATSANSGLTLNLALNYGGREELTHAIQKMTADVRDGRLTGAIDEKTVSRYLYTDGMPDPDLLIRTSGEMRLSNFLLWQLAYTEIYITEVYWPDFGEKDLLDSVESYLGRERRYGKVSEQMRNKSV